MYMYMYMHKVHVQYMHMYMCTCTVYVHMYMYIHMCFHVQCTCTKYMCTCTMGSECSLENLIQISGHVVLLSECLSSHVQHVHVCMKVDNPSFYGFVCVLGVVKSSVSPME